MRQLYILTLAGGVLLTACGDKTPRSASAKETDPSVAVRVESTTTTTPSISGPVSFDVAETAYHEKRYNDAVSLFNAYTESKPQNAWGFFMLGMSAWKAGDRPSAEAAFRHAIGIDSTHVKSYLNLSRLLIESGSPDSALDYLDTVLRIDSSTGEAYRLLGRVREVRGETQPAILAFHQAIVIDPKDVWSMNNLGALLIRQGKFEEALKPLARATDLSPEVATFENNFGMALERTGHVVEAVDAYRAAVTRDSGYSKAVVNLQRLSALQADPSTPPVDVKALIVAFEKDVESWKTATPTEQDE